LNGVKINDFFLFSWNTSKYPVGTIGYHKKRNIAIKINDFFFFFPGILANMQRVPSGITKKETLQCILERETLAGVGIPFSKMSCEFLHAISVLPNTLGK
jgi:hypothetical protein